MILGFISLLLSFGQNYIAKICIPQKVADTMLPCHLEDDEETEDTEERGRHLRFVFEFLNPSRRVLFGPSSSPSCAKVGALYF